MKKVTKKVMSAFLNKESASQGNTTTDGLTVWLYGNAIARWENERIQVSLAGWPTVTTRDRINGLLSLIGKSVRLYQTKFETRWVWPSDHERYAEECSYRDWMEIPANRVTNIQNCIK